MKKVRFSLIAADDDAVVVADGVAGGVVALAAAP